MPVRVGFALSASNATIDAMTTIPRPVPPMNDDERATMAGWLDFYRATLAQKCDGLDDSRLRTASVAPSELTLLGLIQHMAEVERNWFRRVLVGEDIGPIRADENASAGHDGGFTLTDNSSYRAAVEVWEAEVARARQNCATRELHDTSTFRGGEVTLRWI